MRTIVFTPASRLDLLEIWNHIADDSVDAADRVRDKIQSALVRLAQMPGQGHQRVEVEDPSFRFWKVYSYVIAYQYDEDTLTVVRVVHGARNFRSLFRRRRGD